VDYPEAEQTTQRKERGGEGRDPQQEKQQRKVKLGVILPIQTRTRIGQGGKNENQREKRVRTIKESPEKDPRTPAVKNITKWRGLLALQNPTSLLGEKKRSGDRVLGRDNPTTGNKRRGEHVIGSRAKILL